LEQLIAFVLILVSAFVGVQSSPLCEFFCRTY
jgi:hypothetical protein